MSPGRLVRGMLGERGSRIAGRAYRALFVDLAKVTEAVAREIPHRGHVLDVGGGDGAPLNLLLDLRPDIRVTTIDVTPVVGQWIDARHAARVTRLPRTTLSHYASTGYALPDVLLVSDVMHHIPVGERDVFLGAMGMLLQRAPALRIVVKDVEPGHFRATLGYLSDRYVTGDRNVSLLSRQELVAAMQRGLAGIHWSETELFARDKPNYALVFWR